MDEIRFNERYKDKYENNPSTSDQCSNAQTQEHARQMHATPSVYNQQHQQQQQRHQLQQQAHFSYHSQQHLQQHQQQQVQQVQSHQPQQSVGGYFTSQGFESQGQYHQKTILGIDNG